MNIENIQALPLITHVNKDGSQIGGSTPKHYTALQGTAPDTSTLFVISGNTGDNAGEYAVAEWGVEAALPAGVETFFLSYEVSFDVNVLEGRLQAFETDTIVTWEDEEGQVWMFEGGSLQINIEEGWHVQINNAGWEWIDTGIDLAWPVPDKQYAVKIGYALNTAAKTIAIVSYEFAGVAHSIPAVGLPGKKSTWGKNLLLGQVQLTLTKEAATATVEVDKAAWTSS
jgi:hypothetical protein